MTAISICRMHLIAADADADALVTALAAITGTPPPEWLPATRRDGTDSRSALLTVGATTVAVAVGTPALPPLLMLTVPNLPAAVERLKGAGFGAELDQHGEAAVTMPGGGMVLRVTAGADR